MYEEGGFLEKKDFDIDADHLDTPCKIAHDDWKCKGCGAIGKGSAPKICPKCKNDRMEVTAWLCDRCLQEAKEETIGLLEMIFSDLQLGQANLQIGRASCRERV